MPEDMTVKDLQKALDGIPPETKVVGEVCFGEHHGLKLCHVGLGQEEKFVLFFKKRNTCKRA